MIIIFLSYLFTSLARLEKFSAGRLIDFHYVIVVTNNIILRWFYATSPSEWYFQIVCEKQRMAESTAKDAARFMRSQEVGVLESEFESRGNDGENTDNELTSGKKQEVGEDSSAAEGQLRIAEESDDAGRETVAQSPVVSGSVCRPLAGFGQIDESDSEQGDVEGRRGKLCRFRPFY